MWRRRYFRLLDLPAELRNRVYEYTFEGSTHWVSGYESRKYKASKQIYNEAIKIFYRKAIFYFDDSMDGHQWYLRLPSKLRSAITKMQYDTAEELFEELKEHEG